MMMQLLAEASTIDAGAVGQIISTLVGAGAIGGGGYVMGKARKISLSNDPLHEIIGMLKTLTPPNKK